MVAPRRAGCAVASAVLTMAASGACGSAGRPGTAALPAPGGGTSVVVPAGSQVTRLTFAAGGPGRGSTELGEAGRTASMAVFPLLAYRRLCGDVHLDEFGLAPPRLTVDVRLPDGRTGALLVGAANFTGGGRYALEGGSSCVELVTTSSVHALARLAGEEAAAPFRPPPPAHPPGEVQTRGGQPGEGQRPDPDPTDPWVEQVRREQARTGGSAPSGGRVG